METFIPVILFGFLGLFFAPTIVAALSNVEIFIVSEYPFGYISVMMSIHPLLGIQFHFPRFTCMADEEFYKKYSKTKKILFLTHFDLYVKGRRI